METSPDALTFVDFLKICDSQKSSRFQDALVELSEHGIVLIVEGSGFIQSKVYLQRELYTKYEYGAQGRPKFGIILGLLVDCLNTFSSPGHSNTIEIKYPGLDMELLLKSVDTLNACIYSEIRTRIPKTVTWDCNFEQSGNAPLTFTVKIDFMCYANTDLLLAFHFDTEVSYGCKYKFLKATTANTPGNVVREQGKKTDNRKRRNVESSTLGFSC